VAEAARCTCAEEAQKRQIEDFERRSQPVLGDGVSELRAIMERRGARLIENLRHSMQSRYPSFLNEVDDAISSALLEIASKGDVLEKKFRLLKREGKWSGSLEDFMAGCMRVNARHKMFTTINSARRRKTESIYVNGEDGEYYEKPTIVTKPEQEDVLFRKQLLEFCGALDADERAVMALAMDRATNQEILDELGISASELLRRRASALRNLNERAKGKRGNG
jgi:hypothetical protein